MFSNQPIKGQSMARHHLQVYDIFSYWVLAWALAYAIFPSCVLNPLWVLLLATTSNVIALFYTLWLLHAHPQRMARFVPGVYTNLALYVATNLLIKGVPIAVLLLAYPHVTVREGLQSLGMVAVLSAVYLIVQGPTRVRAAMARRQRYGIAAFKGPLMRAGARWMG